VMALAAQCTAGAYFGKYVIVVDDDIDPTNMGQVLWAMATRSRPAQSIDILRETWSTFLDPSLNPPEIRPWGSKALINACMDYKHIKTFSPRTKLDKATYRRVVSRWNELGLSGEPPEVTVFENRAGAENPRLKTRQRLAVAVRCSHLMPALSQSRCSSQLSMVTALWQCGATSLGRPAP
jgi:hypothetical protein